MILKNSKSLLPPSLPRSLLGACFLGLDRVLRVLEPFIPKPLRRGAIERATAWFTERLNGEDGLGGIYPAMANAAMAYRAMGYSDDHPDYAIALKSVRKLLTFDGERKFCQPCLSPIWDTSLATLATRRRRGKRTTSAWVAGALRVLGATLAATRATYGAHGSPPAATRATHGAHGSGGAGR